MLLLLALFILPIHYISCGAFALLSAFYFLHALCIPFSLSSFPLHYTHALHYRSSSSH